MGEVVIQRAFAGGELSPSVSARADQLKYQTGAKTVKNFLVKRGGGLDNRPGTRFVTEVADSDESSWRLMHYESELAGESVLIIAGLDFFWFVQDGAVVTVAPAAYNGATAYVVGDLVSSGGVNYYCIADTTGNAPPNATYWYPMPADGTLEVPVPSGRIGICNYVQSGEIITLTRSDQPPMELIYFSLTRWVVQDVSFEPWADAPTNLAGVAGTAGALDYTYIVTAVKAETYEETLASDPETVASCAEPTEDAPNALTWDAVAGAVEYNVYLDPYGNGTFGYIGRATGAEAFNDVGFVPDFQVGPPVNRNPFSSNYPNIAAYYQQRRFFAYTDAEPERIEASRIGFPANFNITSPLQDDDALSFKIASNHHHPVRWMRDAGFGLVVGTDAGAFRLRGDETGTLTPTAFYPNQESYVGVDEKEPVVVGKAILYSQARKRILNELRFDQQVEGLAGRDLTIYARHLFERGTTIARVDYANTPNSIVWICTGNEPLLGLTYVPEHELWGWHRHELGGGGQVEDIVVVPEADQDALYLLVRRTINGATARYVERLEPREIRDDNFDLDAYFLDCGLTYNGVPVDTITGLDHLEGEAVYALVDGSPQGPFTVASGAITLDSSGAIVHVGYRIEYPDFETLELDVQGSNIRGKRKRVQSVAVVVDRSSRTFSVGPDASNLTPVKIAEFEDATLDEFTGQVELPITSGFSDYGRVFLRQTDPLPLTILAIMPVVEAEP